MKKTSLLIILLVVFGMLGCSSAEKKINKNDIRATLITNKGEINVFLYPDGAPLTVANFVNLAQRGYYDNLSFHRVVEDFVIQGGDPKGDGTGGPGYQFKDEFVDWLDFFQSGILAMANSGPGANGSQFFITMNPAETLNKKHTIFGELVGKDDSEIVEDIEEGDIIQTINIIGDTNWLLAEYKDKIDEWNEILTENGF